MKDLQVADEVLVKMLSEHRLLGQAPREELDWLAERATVREFEAGEVVLSKDERVDEFYIVFSGCIGAFVDRGAGRHQITARKGGDVTGLVPYSRLKNAPGDIIAVEPSTVATVEREDLGPMIRECHEITSMLVHGMVDRVRLFTSSDLQDEKMISLGKLSAGLAHELNNPASAIKRNALLLREQLANLEDAAHLVGASQLTDDQLASVETARASCLAEPVHGVRSPLEEAEREEALSDWFEDHGLDADAAQALVESAVSLETLDRLAAVVQGPPLEATLRWAGSGCSVRRLSEGIEDAAERISGLVAAIKGFTHMDQAEVAQPIDLARGLDDTIAVLRSKARSKSVSIDVQIDPDLPVVQGFAGELNQVWANLIDNALDAVAEHGRVEIKACRDGGRVEVRIIDDGAGIPSEIQEHIFDAFFTTKPVGQGTGLGLDIVRRLIVHNDGDIKVESEPGRTEFQVFLPTADSGSES